MFIYHHISCSFSFSFIWLPKSCLLILNMPKRININVISISLKLLFDLIFIQFLINLWILNWSNCHAFLMFLLMINIMLHSSCNCFRLLLRSSVLRWSSWLFASLTLNWLFSSSIFLICSNSFHCFLRIVPFKFVTFNCS